MRNALRTRNEKNTLQEKSATSEEVARVKKLFDDKGWPLESGEFDDFCTMVANLETEVQKNLILELSQRFYWITANEYYGLFATVYKGNIIKNLIMDCQSYTKYRPNETTGGIFVSWRRKEELPTGA